MTGATKMEMWAMAPGVHGKLRTSLVATGRGLMTKDGAQNRPVGIAVTIIETPRAAVEKTGQAAAIAEATKITALAARGTTRAVADMVKTETTLMGIVEEEESAEALSNVEGHCHRSRIHSRSPTARRLKNQKRSPTLEVLVFWQQPPTRSSRPTEHRWCSNTMNPPKPANRPLAMSGNSSSSRGPTLSTPLILA